MNAVISIVLPWKTNPCAGAAQQLDTL